MAFELPNLPYGFDALEPHIDKETMEILAMSKGIVSEKTLLGKHPFVDDVNSEIFNIDEERRNGFEYDRGENDKNN